ncbi:MAG: hypothetical protein LBK65_00220 [Tannerellaceae bacterium]|nr:hypothetical protein [Tannerellaceae bacterium]
MKLRKGLFIGAFAMCMLAVSGLRAYGAQDASAMPEPQQQTDVDPRLRGEWSLESVEVKIGNTTQRLQVEALMNNPAIRSLVGQFIDDRYFTILFYGNEVGLDLKNPTKNFDRPLKGTYSVAGDRLTISMQDEQSHTFNYRVDGENLSVTYVQGNNQLSLIFKLYLKY